MTARPDRLTELLQRLREAYEIGSPLIVQQRLLNDFSVCLELRGVPPPPFSLPLNEATLSLLEKRCGPDCLISATANCC
jgi:hypothetical protein